MPRKLKVFRTPIGFHDAYVAATSRKAALAAWGSDADLFARGVAEEVTDPKLAKEPLAHPGEVIRLSRGDLPAHLKALPKRNRAKAPRAEPDAKPRKPKPPPNQNPTSAQTKMTNGMTCFRGAAYTICIDCAPALLDLNREHLF